MTVSPALAQLARAPFVLPAQHVHHPRSLGRHVSKQACTPRGLALGDDEGGKLLAFVDSGINTPRGAGVGLRPEGNQGGVGESPAVLGTAIR